MFTPRRPLSTTGSCSRDMDVVSLSRGHVTYSIVRAQGTKDPPPEQVRDFSSSFTYVFTYANDETLATQTQACDQRTVAFNVSVGQVLEQATTLTHQKQQTTA